MTTWRPTPVQQDVIDRLKDGWALEGSVPREIKKSGEAPRHIRFETLISLERRGIIEWDGDTWSWLFHDPAVLA